VPIFCYCCCQNFCCLLGQAAFEVASAAASVDVDVAIIIVNFYAKYILLYGPKRHAKHKQNTQIDRRQRQQKMAPFGAAAVTWMRLGCGFQWSSTPSCGNNIIKAFFWSYPPSPLGLKCK